MRNFLSSKQLYYNIRSAANKDEYMYNFYESRTCLPEYNNSYAETITKRN